MELQELNQNINIQERSESRWQQKEYLKEMVQEKAQEQMQGEDVLLPKDPIKQQENRLKGNKITVIELRDILTKAVMDDYGNSNVYFDVEGRCFNCHIIQVASANTIEKGVVDEKSYVVLRD